MRESGGEVSVRMGRPLTGALAPPGDKSITHRALLLGLAASGRTTVEHANDGEDCRATLRLAEALGARCERHADRWVIEGAALAFRQPAAEIDCGNSGTTLRLGAGLAATNPVDVVLTGDESLLRRPVARIVEPLRSLGAAVTARDGDRFPPLRVRGGSLRGVDHACGVASAQVEACVLLAALGASGSTSVTIPGPARDHTERMFPAFGIPIERTELAGGGRRVRVAGPVTPTAASLRVPGDFSAAAFLLAAAAATPGARVTATGVSLNPTRTALLDALAEMGAAVEVVGEREQAGEPVGTVTVTGPPSLRAFDVPAEWIPRMLDEVPAWAIAASAARGTSRLGGASELRVKESDRLAEVAIGLAALGVVVRERPEGLEVEGGAVTGGEIATRGDHRIVMAFAAIGARSNEPVRLLDAASVSTSFPGFFADLARLGAVVEPGRGAASATAGERRT